MTTAQAPIPHLWIVGAGRMGLALGLMLDRAGAVDRLTYTSPRPAPPDHPLFRSTPPRAGYGSVLTVPSPPPTGVVLAVPDDAVPVLAERLAGLDPPPGAPVLHLSGALGAEALAPLAARSHPVGSLHPLATVPDPVEGVERLRGAWYALEGSGSARSLAERIVDAADGRVLPLEPGAKPVYHAAAVFASNYVVALLAVAERLLRGAGVPEAAARDALSGLAAGAVRSVARLGPVGALTGPAARGDAATLARHLERLSAPDAELYSLLAREALALARERGIEAELAERVERLLEGRG